MAKKKIEIVDSRNNPTEVKIDLMEIEAMAALNLTQEEMAMIKGIWPETFTRVKNREDKLNQAIEIGKIKSKVNLLQQIRKIAENGENDNVKFNALKYLLNINHGINEKSELKIDNIRVPNVIIEVHEVEKNDKKNDKKKT